MFRALSILALIAFAMPAGAVEATESDTGKSPAHHSIVETAVTLAFAQTRATVSGLTMAAKQMEEVLCLQTDEPVSCRLAFQALRYDVERLEVDLARLDAQALAASLTLNRRLFDEERAKIENACEVFAEEIDRLTAEYPLNDLGP